MTARELVERAAGEPVLLALTLLALPVAVVLAGWIHGPGRGVASPWRYLYSVIVYVACVLGIGAVVLTAYTLFFTGENLLDKNLLVYVFPIVSMVATLALIRRQVPFDDVPGFDRLSALMVLIGVTFVALLAIRKTFIGIFFGASLGTLVALGAFVFALLKWGTRALFSKTGAPRSRPPDIPSL